MSDEELMAQVRSGVGEMLGVLFERYHVPLFNFYLKLTGDRPASEDLVQDVYFRMLKYRHSYRDGNPFTSWMYQVARNAHLDGAQKRKGEPSLAEEGMPEPASAEHPRLCWGHWLAPQGYTTPTPSNIPQEINHPIFLDDSPAARQYAAVVNLTGKNDWGRR